MQQHAVFNLKNPMGPRRFNHARESNQRTGKTKQILALKDDGSFFYIIYLFFYLFKVAGSVELSVTAL